MLFIPSKSDDCGAHQSLDRGLFRQAGKKVHSRPIYMYCASVCGSSIEGFFVSLFQVTRGTLSSTVVEIATAEQRAVIIVENKNIGELLHSLNSSNSPQCRVQSSCLRNFCSSFNLDTVTTPVKCSTENRHIHSRLC